MNQALTLAALHALLLAAPAEAPLLLALPGVTSPVFNGETVDGRFVLTLPPRPVCQPDGCADVAAFVEGELTVLAGETPVFVRDAAGREWCVEAALREVGEGRALIACGPELTVFGQVGVLLGVPGAPVTREFHPAPASENVAVLPSFAAVRAGVLDRLLQEVTLAEAMPAVRVHAVRDEDGRWEADATLRGQQIGFQIHWSREEAVAAATAEAWAGLYAAATRARSVA